MSGTGFFNMVVTFMDCLTKCDVTAKGGKTVRIKPREGYYHYFYGDRKDMVNGICGMLNQLRDAWENDKGGGAQ